MTTSGAGPRAELGRALCATLLTAALAACGGSGTAVDAGPADARTVDAGPVDAGPTDAGWAGPRPDLFDYGPHRVGATKLVVSYIPAGETQERQLPVLIWYPTDDTEGTPTRYQLLPIRRDVLLDATPAGAGPYRTVIYSHGNQGIDWVAYPIGQPLATHGVMTITFDHTGNTFTGNDIGFGYEMSALRPQDVSAVLDAVEALPSDHALAGRLGEEVVMVGHSYGGYTALAVGGASLDIDPALSACAEDGSGAGCAYLADEEHVAAYREGFADPRVDLVVAQAPALSFGGFSPTAAAAIPHPVLLMTADLDATVTDAADGDPIWAALDGADDRRVRIGTGGHFTFVPVCYETPGVFTDDGCGEGFLDTRVALPVLTAYVRAFMARHLDGDEAMDAVLDGEEELHPDFRVETP